MKTMKMTVNCGAKTLAVMPAHENAPAIPAAFRSFLRNYATFERFLTFADCLSLYYTAQYGKKIIVICDNNMISLDNGDKIVAAPAWAQTLNTYFTIENCAYLSVLYIGKVCGYDFKRVYNAPKTKIVKGYVKYIANNN